MVTFSTGIQRSLSCPFVLLLLAVLSPVAQEPPAPQEPVPTIRKRTRLVLVDVVATRSRGKPVLNLQADDFLIFDKGKPQQIAVFQLSQPAEGADAPVDPPPLPPNTFTNLPEYQRGEGAYTILFLDLLNTSFRDRVRSQRLVRKYLAENLDKNQRIAIYVLGRKLIRLLDFTSDPELLRDSLQRVPGGLSPVDSDSQAAAGYTDFASAIELSEGGGAGPRMIDAASALDDVEVGDRFTRDLLTRRVHITLWAFDQLARSVDGLPGRKNLIWISGSFPLNFLPGGGGDLTRMRRFRSFSRSLQSVTRTLADARVAVYAIHSGGLQPTPFSAFGGARSMMRGNNSGVGVWRSDLFERQASLLFAADQTGGMGFVNRNDIDGAVAESIADGSTYYTLGFYPNHDQWDGRFRRIKVELADYYIPARLRYRKGYYADADVPASTGNGESPAAEEQDELHKVAEAIRGFSSAFQVAFLAQVASEPGPGNTLPMEVAVDLNTLKCSGEVAGSRYCRFSLMAGIFSPDGKLVGSAGRYREVDIASPQLAGAGRAWYVEQFELPIGPGRYRLRLVVRDSSDGSYGAMDFPLVVPDPSKPPRNP